MNPNLGWDVVRHFEYMNQIRGSGMSFFTFLFNNNALVGGGGYKSLIIFNLLRYFVVSVTNNNFLLPAICIVIDYSIIGYIIIDWTSSNDGNYKLDIFTLLLCFSFAPYVHAVSGMRNILCASIMALAAYLYLYKAKSIIILIVLSFIAITIHPAAMITVPFIFLAKMKLGGPAFIAVFAISALAKPVAQRLSYSRIDFLVLIGRKYLSYTSDDQYRSSRTPLYGVLIVTAIFLLFVQTFQESG